MTETELVLRRDRRAAKRRRLTSDKKRRASSVTLFLRDVLIIFVAAIVISVGIKTFLVRSFYIPSSSMENTLQRDDRIIVNQLIPGMFPVDHGDVVVFKDPGGWLTPEPVPDRPAFVEAVDWVLGVVGLSAPDSNDHLVKRVIGLPGDTVECCNAVGQVSVNGVSINEPYLKLRDGERRASGTDFSVVVPDDSLWVLGDNRYDSCDSRCNMSGPSGGFVPLANVVGKAFVITWPLNHWSGLDNYPNTFAGVKEAQKPAPETSEEPPTEAPAEQGTRADAFRGARETPGG